MTTEMFFEKFELLAATPDAVLKTRELVLGLAVEGKLVPQSEQDVPASVLLEKANAHAAALPDAAKRKRLIAEWGVRSRDLNGELPTGWAWACNAIIGDTSPRVNCQDDAVVAFAPMNLLPTDYRAPFAPETRAWGEIKRGYTHFADGDVVIAKITPCFQNGKGCVFSGLPGGVGAGTTELHVLRPYPGVVLPLYALLWFKSPDFVEGGVASFTGTAGQQRVSNDYFRFRPFPLPPLDEQKRIVAKVDGLMALCDRLEAQQAERQAKHAVLARASLARFAEAPTPPNLCYLFHGSYSINPADLRKSILTLAMHGRLVPQDPKDQPAEQLLTRLDADRAIIAKKQGIRVPKAVEAVAFGECPHGLPANWEWCRFGRLALVIDYGTSHKADGDASQVPVYRMGNIVGGRLIDENFKYVHPAIDDLPGLYLKRGDILFNRTNSYELVGKVGLYEGKDDVATFASYLIRVRLPSTHLLPKFFALVMNSPYFRQTQIEPEVVQQCGQANFSGTKLSSTIVPVPPLAEQRRIVTKVDQLMVSVDRLETQLAESRTAAKRLMEAVVGELTSCAAPQTIGV
jgi:type I restriction enzyme S subunit